MKNNKIVKEKSKMKKYEIISTLNCNDKENYNKIISLSNKIINKYFSEINLIDLENINCEKLLKIVNCKMFKKFNCYLSYMFFSRQNKDGISASLINSNSNKHDLICTIYAKTFDEILRKAIICIYYFVKEELEELV